MKELLKRPVLLVFLAVLFASLYKYCGTVKNYAVHGLPVGASAAAKLGCSFYFVTGRSADQVKSEDLAPLNPVLGLFDLQFDDASGIATASALGLVSRRAQHRPGLGCTLIPEGQETLAAVVIERLRVEVPEFQRIEADAALRAAVESEFLTTDTRAVVVLQDGKLVMEQYAAGFDAQSKLLSWSMAKSVTSTAIGLLVKRGVLSLEQDHLFAEWQDDDRANIKLIDLLQMSSGLDFDEIYGPGSDVTNMLFVEADMSRFVASSSLAATPGDVFNYSSGTTVLLMRLIKETMASADAYHAFIYQDVLDAVGMVDSVFEADGAGVLVGSSYLFGTSHDYARFGQFYLDLAKGEVSDLLPEHWYATVSTPAKAAEEGKYGAQFWLNKAGTRFEGVPADVLMALGHNGQVIAVLPSQNAVLVRLGWSTDGVFKPEHFISRLLEAM